MKNVSGQLQSTNQEVISIDDYFNQAPEVKEEVKPKRPNNFLNKKSTESKEKAEKFALSADPLMKDARDTLNIYLKKIPSYNSMEAQKRILEKEMNLYKKNGDTLKQQQCVEILKSLNEKTINLKELFVPIEGVKLREKIKDNNEKFKSSPKLKELREKERNIKANLEKNSASKIIDKLSALRKLMKIDDNNVMDIDNFFVQSDNATYTNYNNLLEEISTITGYLPTELDEMSVSAIRDYLKENLKDVVEDNNDELKLVRAEMQAERDSISGAISMTSILDSIYDVRNESDLKATKDILASTHIGMVRSIAYTACNNAGLKGFEYYDDCIGAGLLALTVAINGFLTLKQENPTSALSFKGWARINVSNAIKRELYSMQSGGRVSGSRIADMKTRETRKINTFLENYPVYKDFDKELVKEIVLASESEANERKYANTNDISLIVTESDIKSGGESADDGADLWANASMDNSTDMIEANSEYGELVNNIAELIKIFDKYEKKLFMMYFGFEKKIDKSDTSKTKVSNNYSQEEIGKELYDFYLSQGIKPPKVIGDRFSQPAIAYKVQVIKNKLIDVLTKRPELKSSMEYLTTYWAQNTDALTALSNDREEFGMKFERDKLKNEFFDNDDVLNMQLSDGKKLKDEFDISQKNIFTNQMYDAFVIKKDDYGQK